MLAAARGECELLGLPIESVDVLGADVAQQKRGIVGSHPKPDAPVTRLAEVFQVCNLLDLPVTNANPHHRRVIRLMEEVDIVSVLDQLGKPMLIFAISSHFCDEKSKSIRLPDANDMAIR